MKKTLPLFVLLITHPLGRGISSRELEGEEEGEEGEAEERGAERESTGAEVVRSRSRRATKDWGRLCGSCSEDTGELSVGDSGLAVGSVQDVLRFLWST